MCSIVISVSWSGQSSLCVVQESLIVVTELSYSLSTPVKDTIVTDVNGLSLSSKSLH